MNYSIEELEQIMLDGRCDVICPKCEEEYTLEPDGWADCECGTRVSSPLAEMGLI